MLISAILQCLVGDVLVFLTVVCAAFDASEEMRTSEAECDNLRARLEESEARVAKSEEELAIAKRDLSLYHVTATRASRIIATSCVRCPVSQTFVRNPAILLNEKFELVPVDGLPTITSHIGCVHAFHFDSVEPWVSQHKTCPTCRMEVTKVVHLRGLGADFPLPELEGDYQFEPVPEEEEEREADRGDRQEDALARELEDMLEEHDDMQPAYGADRDIEFLPGGVEQVDW